MKIQTIEYDHHALEILDHMDTVSPPSFESTLLSMTYDGIICGENGACSPRSSKCANFRIYLPLDLLDFKSGSPTVSGWAKTSEA